MHLYPFLVPAYPRADPFIRLISIAVYTNYIIEIDEERGAKLLITFSARKWLTVCLPLIQVPGSKKVCCTKSRKRMRLARMQPDPHWHLACCIFERFSCILFDKSLDRLIIATGPSSSQFGKAKRICILQTYSPSWQDIFGECGETDCETNYQMIYTFHAELLPKLFPNFDQLVLYQIWDQNIPLSVIQMTFLVIYGEKYVSSFIRK